MAYDPKKHNRQTIRKKGYNYSSPGHYFITLSENKRRRIFSRIVNGKVFLSAIGEMIMHWYLQLSNKFPFVKTHEIVIMPDHVHFVVEIIDSPERTAFVEAVLSTEKDFSILKRVLQWFKSNTTTSYISGVKNKGWPRFNRKLWQTNYYECIVWTQYYRNNIANYIQRNPEKWNK